MIRKKLLFAYGRSVTGLALSGLFWFIVGWALSSLALGFILALWSVLIGPLLVPLAIWGWARVAGRLRAVDLSREPTLAREYFAGILAMPGPHPRVWVRESNDLSSLWFESNAFSPYRQEIVLTTSWMRQDEGLKAQDWKALWKSIARIPQGERRLQRFQMAAWAGALSPLELLLYVFHLFLEIFGLDDLPSPAFWFQRICWTIKGLWFGLPEDSGSLPIPTRGISIREPGVWNSLVLGVWFQIPVRVSHPTWLLFTHRSAFLEDPSRHLLNS